MAEATRGLTTAGPAAMGTGRGAPPEVWLRVREDYLAGVPALECCRRHGVGRTSLRDRAAREGWRREDQPWTPPNRLDPDDEGVRLDLEIDGDLDRLELGRLIHVADRRMMRAVLRGDATDALRWRRVALMLQAQEAEEAREMAQDEALCFHLFGGQHPRDAACAPTADRDGDPDPPDCPDPVFGSGSAGTVPLADRSRGSTRSGAIPMSILGNILGGIFHKKDDRPATPTPQAAPVPTAAPTPTPPPAAPVAAAPAEPVDVAGILDFKNSVRDEKLNWRTSIVDLMKLLGLDSSLEERKKLADELGYTGDKSDSVSMNIWLHKQVIQKIVDNGGQLPRDL